MEKFVCKMKPEEVAKLLQEGKIIKDLTSDAEYRLVNGLLYNSDTRCLSNSLFLDDDDLYFEIEEPFQIKETGLYKTRAGRKVFVSYIDRCVIGVLENDCWIRNWEINGNYDDKDKTEFDIVSKWDG